MSFNTFVQGSHGPQRSSDAGQVIITLGEASAIGEVFVPDYTDTTGSVTATGLNKPNSAETVWIPVDSAPQATLLSLMTPYVVVTEAKAAGQTCRAVMRGEVKMLLTANLGANYDPLGIASATGIVDEATTGQIVIGMNLGVAGTSGNLHKVYLQGDMVRQKV